MPTPVFLAEKTARNMLDSMLSERAASNSLEQLQNRQHREEQLLVESQVTAKSTTWPVCVVIEALRLHCNRRNGGSRRVTGSPT